MPLAHLQVLISYNYWNQKNNISTIPLTNPQTLLKFTILLHTVFELHVTLSNFPAPDCLSLLLWYYFFYFISVLNLLHFFLFVCFAFCSKQQLKVPVILHCWSQALPLGEDMTLSYLLNYHILPSIQTTEILPRL